MITYKLRIDTISNEKTYTAYGVEVFENDQGIKSYPDLFVDYDKALKFVDLLNSEKLELVHIEDVIEDTLFLNCYGGLKP